jgi:hypothetical protein
VDYLASCWWANKGWAVIAIENGYAASFSCCAKTKAEENQERRGKGRTAAAEADTSKQGGTEDPASVSVCLLDAT